MRSIEQVACCDASVVVLYVTEPNAIAIQQLWSLWQTDRVSVVAPSLMRFEVTNALHRIAVRDKLTDAQAAGLLADALALPISFRDYSEMHERALALSRRFELRAAYDAHYLALAESLACNFYTTDAKLHRAVRDRLPFVTLVS